MTWVLIIWFMSGSDAGRVERISVPTSTACVALMHKFDDAQMVQAICIDPLTGESIGRLE
jgi:hypothetical protein